MNVQEILTAKLALSPFLERPPSIAEDLTLERSIRDTGVRQPLVAVQIGDNLQVADGGRRLIAAKKLGIPKLRVAIYELPEGEDARLYPLKLRFILDQHRQDLLPSQRAELLAKIKAAHGFGNTEMAAYLGVAPESIRNWLSPNSYIKEIRDLLDSFTITMNAARIFEGMSEHGQRYILKHHLAEMTGPGGKDGLATKLRKQYPPLKNRNMYTDPEGTERNLGIAKQRRGAVRSRVANTTTEEKKRLLSSVEIKEAEIASLDEDIAEMDRDINAAMPIVAAIFRNKSLRALVPDSILEELERFHEAYPTS